jgi:toxin ParE1/3/4
MGFGIIRRGIGVQAERYVRLIGAVIQALADAQHHGKACNHIREGYWKRPAGSHVIFYRHLDGGLAVVRILHNPMDFDRHFG